MFPKPINKLFEKTNVMWPNNFFVRFKKPLSNYFPLFCHFKIIAPSLSINLLLLHNHNQNDFSQPINFTLLFKWSLNYFATSLPLSVLPFSTIVSISLLKMFCFCFLIFLLFYFPPNFFNPLHCCSPPSV